MELMEMPMINLNNGPALAVFNYSGVSSGVIARQSLCCFLILKARFRGYLKFTFQKLILTTNGFLSLVKPSKNQINSVENYFRKTTTTLNLTKDLFLINWFNKRLIK